MIDVGAVEAEWRVATSISENQARTSREIERMGVFFLDWQAADLE